MKLITVICLNVQAMDENHFAHLEGIVHPEKYEILTSMTHDDKIHIMGELVTKMDIDGDENIGISELSTWIHYVEQARLHKEVYEQFPLFDTDRDQFISMEEYNQRTYDFIHDEEYKDSLTQEDIDHVEASNKRDIRRFLEADGNSDGQLDIVEFSAFLHPHSHDHMQDVLLMETFEEMDSNLDGKVDFPEYLAHISGYAERAAESEEFMESEMGYFNELDLNSDGGLNQTEVKEWIRPEGSNPIDAEVQHMMRKMDLDEDGRLSRTEILDNYPEFLHSTATDWGKALLAHDEL